MDQSIRTVATFQSEKFNVAQSQEQVINSCCSGDDLCHWIISRLQAQKIVCDDKPGREDFGWYFNFTLSGCEYCCVCLLREADGDNPAVWVLWIERNSDIVAAASAGHEKHSSFTAPQLVHKILSQSTEISNIRWHFKKDFDKGREEAGSVLPA